MKNSKWKVILTVMMCAALFSGCGKKKKEETLAKLDTSKYVTLGAYSGQDIKVEPMEEITDEVVETYIFQNYLREYAAETEVTGRPVKSGDMVYIGCVGRVDGEIFEGGSTAEGQEWDVEIGSGSMIPGFEEGIIGMEIGEVRDVTCVFPDPYEYNPDLAGKEAVFTITLNSITEITYPELTAELIADMELPYATPEEMKLAARNYLETETRNYYDDTVNAELLDMAIENSEFAEKLPDFLMDKNKQAYENNLLQYAAYYGFSDVNAFVSALGMTQEQYEEDLQSVGEMFTKKDLVVEAIADAEGLREISDQELDREAVKYINENNVGYTDIESLYDAVGRDTFRNYVIEQRVYDWLLKNNNIQPK